MSHLECTSPPRPSVLRLKAITRKQIERKPSEEFLNGSDRLKLLDKCGIYMTKT